MSLNVWRVIADVSHTVSKCTLIWAIHANASAEGVSLITQALYAVVFCSRYLDLFWSHPFTDHRTEGKLLIPLGVWNFTLKIFYILSSLYILFIMLRVYGRTHERERAWRFGYACLGGSLLLAPLSMLLMTDKPLWSVWECVWTFSEILESVCILPQLLLLRQTTVPTVIDSFYLVTLGCYRFFYIPNWILIATQGRKPPIVSIVFGIIQTAFYVDFAWVYYTRQRVKLRNGALVDSEDFTKGWLVNKILGGAGFKTNDYDGPVDGNARSRAGLDPEFGIGEDEEDAVPVRPRTVGSQGGWGKRGISVSADDEDDIATPVSAASTKGKGLSSANARTEEQRAMLQNLDDDEEDARPANNGGSEWK